MSFERLERLINLAKSWNGPMSVGVSVKDSKKELPIILDAWLNNEHMRRNADIHILFDDQVIISFYLHFFLFHYSFLLLSFFSFRLLRT